MNSDTTDKMNERDEFQRMWPEVDRRVTDYYRRSQFDDHSMKLARCFAMYDLDNHQSMWTKETHQREQFVHKVIQWALLNDHEFGQSLEQMQEMFDVGLIPDGSYIMAGYRSTHE